MRARGGRPSLLVTGLATLVAACGGGDDEGGGSGGGTRLELSSGSVEATADRAGFSPTATLDLTIINPPRGNLHIGGQFTRNGIAGVTLDATSETTGVVSIHFKDPSQIEADTYEDTLQLGVCTNSNCNAIEPGTLRTVDVTYVVTGLPPTAEPSTRRVEMTGVPFTAQSPLAIVGIALERVQAADVSAETHYTRNGVAHASASLNPNGGLDLQIAFEPATFVGFGTYEDTVTVRLCRTATCPTPLQGSPIVISTRYTISRTVAGENGYTIREVTASVNDVIWDETGGTIYLTTATTDPVTPDSVVALDPLTGVLGASVFAGDNPSFGAVSDGGEYLYVGFAGSSTVRRFTLPDLSPEISIPLGSYPSGPLFAGDIQAFPDRPASIVVARSPAGGYPWGYDVAVFDDDVQRTHAVHRDDASFTSVQFGASAGVLYGGDGVISTMAVNDDGLALAGSADFSLGYGPARVHFDDGILYTDRGLAIEPVGGTLAGTFEMATGEFGQGAVPDSNLNRIFFLIRRGGYFLVRSYDLGSFTPIAEVPLAGIDFRPNQPLRIIRWGADGLAIPTGDGRVLLITGPFVNPGAE